MPDTDAPSRSETISLTDRVNLPVPVPRPSEVAREPGDSWIHRVLRAMFGWKPNSIRADFEVVLEAGASGESGFSPEERTMLQNVLALRGRRIDDVMVPRADIIAVQQDIALGDLIKVFEGAGHSRLVVYNDTLDDPAGMVHIRDVIGYMVRHATVSEAQSAKRKRALPAGLDLKAVDLAASLSATKIIRQLLFVPPSMPALDLLAKMQATRIHLALVIDEYGGTDGIVSIEDIVEQIVGEIADEHDEDAEVDVMQQPDGSYIADARAKIEDVVLIVGKDFDIGDAADDVDTLGGYLVSRAGRLPLRGQIIPGPAMFEFEVLDADPRRVKRVRIIRLKERRERTRETRKRDEPDAVLAGTTPPTLPIDETPAPTESAGPAPRSSATKRRS
jgi:CBS domain containing-hemolysin-like protein